MCRGIFPKKRNEKRKIQGQNEGRAEGISIGKQQAAQQYVQRNEDAIQAYVDSLGELIRQGSWYGRPTEQDARSIVQTRNAIRNSVMNILNHLNSEIDEIADLLERKPTGDSERRTWEEKLRSLLSSLPRFMANQEQVNEESDRTIHKRPWPYSDK